MIVRAKEVECFTDIRYDNDVKTKDKSTQLKEEKHEKANKGIYGKRCEGGTGYGIAHRSKQYILLSFVSA